MYMGLVQGMARVVKAERLPDRIAYILELPEHLTHNVLLGASISVEGVCLSVTSIDGLNIGFDATEGTLNVTNLAQITDHAWLNVERSAKLGDEIGGHIVAGHISCMAQIMARNYNPDQHMWIKLRIPAPWNRYVFNRGFLAVNGCSLTVAAVEQDVYTINLIPETLRQTTFSLYKPGDSVNIEVDSQTMTTVDTIERTVEATLERLMTPKLA